MATAYLTAQRLREILHYNPETGLFTWLVQIGHRCKAGELAGRSSVNGYAVIGVYTKVYYAHRLAWLYVHGDWPKNHIDHINGNRGDNRISNLRDVSNQVNCENRRKSKTEGRLLGTYLHKASGLWTSRIQRNRKVHSLGYFKTEQEAHDAYIVAKRILHPGCTI